MKKILKGIAALFVLYMLFIILYVVLGITRCSYGVAKSVREASFNYTIFNQNHSKDVEEKINNSLLQYSDDFAVFKIISSYSDDIQKEIINSINLNKEIKITTTTSDYNETVIKSYNSK